MALSNQIHIHSVDTGAFYNRKEKKIHYSIIKQSRNKKAINNKIHNFEKEIKTLLIHKDDYRIFAKGEVSSKKKKEYKNNGIDINEVVALCKKHKEYVNCRIAVNKTLREKKSKLHNSFKEKYKSNCKHKNMRNLRSEYIKTKNVVSIFESSLTRTLNLENNELTDALFIVRVFYFKVLKDIVNNGFKYNGEEYQLYTASAGQIRTKKAVFIKKKLWDKHEKTLMCGLSLPTINGIGGVNRNKYLAYLALFNSATDKIDSFDIDKCIVVDDLETNVSCEVDYIDDVTFDITRKVMDIPITHTDGLGICLPSIKDRNFMIRLAWVKGLITPFNFRKFIKENNGSSKIKDIYGKEYDIFEDDIQIIFTKSQFKMWKYYDSWEQYCNYFKQYNCHAGECNVEEDYISNSKINYQMLQTLDDMTNEELVYLTTKSNNKITRLTSSLRDLNNAMGVKHGVEQTYLKECLKIYPEMYQDNYVKDVIKQIKKSLVRNYRAGKLEIDGKHLFLIPDTYAFCEYLFLGMDKPKGLLADGEVYSELYQHVDYVDCLRSPHLYKEHAVRKVNKSKECKKWFTQKGIYVSTHDCITKIIMADFDGDSSLVVADQKFVDIAKRNMKDVVPLYYDMKQANPDIINTNSLYEGMIHAYTGGNIGTISNTITKIYNSGRMTQEKLDIVKIQCALNNFVIDYAKTLYKPTVPNHINELMKVYNKQKVPYFFRYAKLKEKKARVFRGGKWVNIKKTIPETEKKNNSVVNRIGDLIKDKRLVFSALNLGEFNYEKLMSDKNIVVDNELIKQYIKLNRRYGCVANNRDKDENNYAYIAKETQDELNKFGYTREVACDMIIKYLYDIKNSVSKDILWFCYGDIILKNLKLNIGADNNICTNCGKRFSPTSPNQKRCDECQGYQKLDFKSLVCIDCGDEFEVDARNMTKVRCDDCQLKVDKIKKSERNKRYYINKK